MLTRHTLCLSFLVVSLCLTTALAQDDSAKSNKQNALTITASASADSVRFTAPSSAVQIRLEVYDSAGKKVFDIEVRGGNVLDWRLQNGQAERLVDDTYLCVVTVKSISGRLIQRIGSVTVGKGVASVQAVEASQMSAQQSEAVGPVEENSSLSVLREDENQTATVIAHNGTEGQLIRGQGALSFRIGNFFSGKDTEQMRLTEEGNLGIGTASPQARLDVAGMIRTQGLILPDGSILTSAGSNGGLPGGGSDIKGTIATLGKKKSGQVHGEVLGPISGDGTVNMIAKFSAANTIANSALSEVGGNVGIGTASPGGQLHIFGSATADVFAGMGPDLINGPAFNYGYAGSSFGRGAGFFNVRPDSSAVAPNPSLRFETANVQRMIITNLGNVGIGTTTPGSLFHLAGGNVLNSPQGDLIMSRFWASASNTRGSALFHFFSTVTSTDMLVFGVAGDAGGAQQSYLTPNQISQAKMVILANGNVGMGTTAPQATLDVRGDAVQSRSAGGFAKAMINVSADGTIASCYNSQATGSAVSTPPCGFTINNVSPGTYLIDFGFAVRDRFSSVTPNINSNRNMGAMTARLAPTSVNELFVITFNSSDDMIGTNAPFTVIIF
jgi:hypothetical protein